MHPETARLLSYFEYDHLPPKLREVSAGFHRLAHQLVDPAYSLEGHVLLEGPEATAGLRKLLEAKDCMVRAAL